MVDLNKVDANNELIYYVNSVGVLNFPEDDPNWCDDESTSETKELCDEYWRERNQGEVAVVKYKGQSGLLVNYPFEEEWVRFHLERCLTEDAEMLYSVVKKVASELEKDEFFSSCTVMVGNYSDCDAHELAVFIPYAERANSDEIIQTLDATVYYEVEQFLWKMFKRNKKS